MSKHTPGPWKIDRRRSWSEVRDPEGYVLAEVGAINCDASTAKANARLITAAPDMLDALYQLHAAAMNIEGDALFDSKPSQVAIRQLGEALTVSRAAIAKATGGKS